MLSCFSCVRLCVTPWTAAHQAPLSPGFSRQEYWSGLPFPSPELMPNFMKFEKSDLMLSLGVSSLLNSEITLRLFTREKRCLC